MKRSSLSIAIALALLLSAGIARGDKFKLKDGSTIVGTVVGYVGDSFKVKTSYGYALVEKDKIVSIQISAAPDSPAAKDAAKTDATKGAAAAHNSPAASTNAGTKGSAGGAVNGDSSASHSSATADKAPGAVPAGPRDSLKGPGEASQSAQTPSNSTPAPLANPAAADMPPPIREQVTGNTYVNDTYEFQMYKPPDWQVMDGARSVLPGAIAAMGTDDQTTYLVISQEPSGKSAAADSAAMEQRLSDVLANYRPLSDEHLTVAGESVVAHRFRGSVDEYEWSGFMVFLPRGGKLYTIFGMTRADNDLVQIQENVIRRTISSFQFLPQ